MGKELDFNEVRQILVSGQFDQFKGAIETQIFECKSAPYRLDSLHQKQELAKDVSGIANAGGGFILIGVQAEPNIVRTEEEVTEVRPFTPDLFNVQQYYDVLKQWIHPSIERVKIEWLPSADDGTKGIGSIFVPPQPAERGPFLITRTVDEQEKTTEIVFGYVERRRTSVEPMSVQRLHAIIQTGTHFYRFAPRLENIEELLEQLTSRNESQVSLSPAAAPNPVSDQAFFRHIEQAITNADFDDKPSFALGARPVNQTDIPTLFRSRQEEVVQLLEHPPQFGDGNFNLDAKGSAQMVEASLRRVVSPGQGLLELWRNGSLIYVGRGDEWFLCWPPLPGGKSREVLVVNTVALLQSIYLFVELSKKIYAYAQPQPEEVHFTIELHKLTKEQPSILGKPDPRGRFLSPIGSPAPSSGIRKIISANISTTETGAIAFELAAQVFEWYGAEHDQIPFQEPAGSLDRERLAKVTGNG